MMKAIRDLFGGLRWKLTLSYTLVTVATLLVLELFLIGGISFLVVNSNILPSALISAVDFFIVPQVTTFLDQPQPDVESLTAWLEFAFAEGITFRSSQNPNISLRLGDLDQDSSLIVLDKNLDWLAGRPTPDQREMNEIREGAGEILSTALRGETAVGRVSQISNGLMTIAVPVADDDGIVLGVVVMAISYPPAGFNTPATLAGWQQPDHFHSGSWYRWRHLWLYHCPRIYETIADSLPGGRILEPGGFLGIHPRSICR